MRCHLVTVTVHVNDSTKVLRRYVATSADAAATKKEWQELYGLKRGQVAAEQTEVPTVKDELLDFINSLLPQP